MRIEKDVRLRDTLHKHNEIKMSVAPIWVANTDLRNNAVIRISCLIRIKHLNYKRFLLWG